MSADKPLRLWPGIAAGVVLVVAPLVLPMFMPAGGMIGLMGGGFAILLWWVFFSRVPWIDRLGALLLAAVGVLATRSVVHPSIENGMMGGMQYILSVPVQGFALVLWAVASRPLSDGLRRATLVVAVLLACGAFTLVRTGGITGEGSSDLHWRWTPTPEDRLLAQEGAGKAGGAGEAGSTTESPLASSASSSVVPPVLPASPALPVPPALPALPAPPVPPAPVLWPGFRGPNRDDVIRGVTIETDWAKSPPVQIWKRPIGPGWSSFSVQGNLIYTQEQRGDDEIVACYKLSTGEPVWMHRDGVRFWESNGGAGPRATPTLSNGRAYAFGATGILNALDARSGAVVWSRNVSSDTHVPVPEWGFTSSPIVVNDEVIVAVAGVLAAFDVATGKPRWVGPRHEGAMQSYSSPHRATLGGVDQILLMSDAGTTSVAPADGKVLWDYAWASGPPIVQPAITPEGDVLVNSLAGTGGSGVRRIAVTSLDSTQTSTATERWTSTGLKPYFNDFVVHKGHAFGFDGNILSSIDLADGKRKWKGGRYGAGQLLLLADQDVLLVISEEGELALVAATPDKFTELATFPALDAKTWNHPVLVGDVLLVRNGEEMAAFRLELRK